MFLTWIKQFFKLNTPINKTFFYIGLILMFSISVSRIALSFLNNTILGDFYCHLDFTHAVSQRLDPYDLKNLCFSTKKWDDALIIFPGIFFFYQPFLLLTLQTGKVLNVTLNFLTSCGLFFLFFKNAGLFKEISFKRPDVRTFLVFFLGFMFINSSPVMMTTRHGQVTMFFTAFLLLTLYAKHHWSRVLFFGLAAGIKYSMITIFAPALFLKKYYLTCILACGVFLFIAAFPVFWGNNPITIYSRYLDVLRGDLGGGFNTYAISGYNMLHLEFFKYNGLNIMLKAICGLLALYIIFKDRNKDSFGMNFLFVIMCLSMLLSYHRLYDTPLIMLCLLANFYLFILNKEWKNILISAVFIAFSMVPFSVVMNLAQMIADVPYVADIFIVSRYFKITVFPLPAIIFLLLSTYAAFIYFRKPERIIFELTIPNIQEKQNAE